MKKIIIISLLINLLLISLTGCANYENEGNELNSTIKQTSNYISHSSELTEKLTEPPTEEATKKELSLNEFMDLCQEKYYDDFFKYFTRVGEYVKVYAMVSDKYEYSSSDMFGILTEDITDKYNLEMNCVVCSVLHEDTKNNDVPSYFGKHIYVALEKYYAYSINQFKQGKKIIIYGEVIKNSNEYFILTKYIEWEEA